MVLVVTNEEHVKKVKKLRSSWGFEPSKSRLHSARLDVLSALWPAVAASSKCSSQHIEVACAQADIKHAYIVGTEI
jgi:hypothetical protein